MFLEERHQEILALLSRNKRVKAREIEEKFKVAFATARRDLRILEEKGLLKRTHGGAVPLLQVGHKSDETKTPRDGEAVNEYDLAVAKEAVKFIKENDIVYINSGFLGFYMVQNLPFGFDFTVVTNSVILAEELRVLDHIKVFLIGGMMSSKGLTSHHFAIEMVRNMRFDVSFITADAYDSEFGLSTENSESILMYQEIIKSSRKVIALFPHEKMSMTSSKCTQIRNCLIPTMHLGKIN